MSSAGSIHVAIVGGGGTGIAIAHDLALRGFACTLLERGEFTSGTTGRHHGQLHSGARYAVGDSGIARECIGEVSILGRIAPESIEMNYGLFLALTEEDVAYADTFESACARASIPVRRIDTKVALLHEPAINPRAKLAMVVPDGTIDAYRLPMQFAATAHANGATLRRFVEVIGMDVGPPGVTALHLRNHVTRLEETIHPDIVVNAAGPWAGRVAALAHLSLPITPAPGTLVAVKGRLCNMVVSRLHPPDDGDIIVPQRQLSIIGSTQSGADNPDAVPVHKKDIPLLLKRADDLVPGFSTAEFHAAWTATRPLWGVSSGDARGLSRDFFIRYHSGENSRGFYTIAGGKATTLRAMAEAVADQICRDTGIDAPCETATTVLRSHRDIAVGVV